MPLTIEYANGLSLIASTALNTEQFSKLVTRGLLHKQAVSLLVRMERFTHRVAIIVAVAALVMAGVALMQGMPLKEIFLLPVALAVSALPEGLPVALTVALAIGMQRMARRNVIVRHLVAVEALGSCTYITTDKTGTQTENRLTGRRIAWPAREEWIVTGDSLEPRGEILTPHGTLSEEDKGLLMRLCQAAVLANEG